MLNIVSIHLTILNGALDLYGNCTSLFHRQVSTKWTRNTRFYLILVRVERGGVFREESISIDLRLEAVIHPTVVAHS